MLDIAKTTKLVDQWSDTIVPTLVEYIKIPNKSPAFDSDWAANSKPVTYRLCSGAVKLPPRPFLCLSRCLAEPDCHWRS